MVSFSTPAGESQLRALPSERLSRKAFETLTDGDNSVEEAFMPYLLLPGGSTLGDRVAGDILGTYAGDLECGAFELNRPALTAGT